MVKTFHQTAYQQTADSTTFFLGSAKAGKQGPSRTSGECRGGGVSTVCFLYPDPSSDLAVTSPLMEHGTSTGSEALPNQGTSRRRRTARAAICRLTEEQGALLRFGQGWGQPWYFVLFREMDVARDGRAEPAGPWRRFRRARLWESAADACDAEQIRSEPPENRCLRLEEHDGT
jgi:hypothetical protein